MERCLTTEGTTETATLIAVDEPTEQHMYDTVIDNWADNRRYEESREVSQAEDQRL